MLIFHWFPCMCLQGISGMGKERIACWREDAVYTQSRKVFREEKVTGIPRDSQALDSSTVCWDPHLSARICVWLQISPSQNKQKGHLNGKVRYAPFPLIALLFPEVVSQCSDFCGHGSQMPLTPQWRMAVPGDQEALWKAEGFIFERAAGWSGSERFQRDRHHRPEVWAKCWRTVSLCTSFNASSSKIWSLDLGCILAASVIPLTIKVIIGKSCVVQGLDYREEAAGSNVCLKWRMGEGTSWELICKISELVKIKLATSLPNLNGRKTIVQNCD